MSLVRHLSGVRFCSHQSVRSGLLQRQPSPFSIHSCSCVASTPVHPGLALSSCWSPLVERRSFSSSVVALSSSSPKQPSSSPTPSTHQMSSSSTSSTAGTKSKETVSDGEEGLHQLPATRIFRVLNFELFARPRKGIYLLGTSLFAGIVGYLLYERNRWMKENQEEKERVALARERRVQRRLSRS
mmetsp:Transcript_14778/g.44341  ORF Transcript_14778/g.44341 Transcript_14778/m.44341 type:complete len:185 (+) Transcript_14778:94-648(+)